MCVLKIIKLLLASVLIVPLNLPAFEKDFPPYPAGKFPPTCKIHPVKASQETDRNKGSFKSIYALSDQSLKLALHLNMNYQKGSSGMYASLKNASGKVLVKPVKIGGHPTDINSVYWAYLNKDNRKDYIINMDTGDGYLSAGKQQTTFLLSNKHGYSIKKVGVYSLTQQDFYDYSTDHKCEFLHQALLNDGQNNYWVYNVLQFIDGQIVIKNQLSRYFPKWIKMTPAANDKAASLSTEKKKKLSQMYKKQQNIKPVK